MASILVQRIGVRIINRVEGTHIYVNSNLLIAEKTANQNILSKLRVRKLS
jgi:hypothetical protein